MSNTYAVSPEALRLKAAALQAAADRARVAWEEALGEAELAARR